MRTTKTIVAAPLALLLIVALAYAGARGARWLDWRAVGSEGVVFTQGVVVRGTRHELFVRGLDRDAPLLVFLPGGPGESMVPFSQVFTDRLQERFVVAHLESGVGKAEAYSEGPTLERYTRDVAAVIERFRERLGGRPVLLVGNSLGSIHALTIARDDPGAASGVVTIGQTVDWPEGSALATAELIARAEAADDASTARAARALPADLVTAADPEMIDFAAVAAMRGL